MNGVNFKKNLVKILHPFSNSLLHGRNYIQGHNFNPQSPPNLFLLLKIQLEKDNLDSISILLHFLDIFWTAQLPKRLPVNHMYNLKVTSMNLLNEWVNKIVWQCTMGKLQCGNGYRNL